MFKLLKLLVIGPLVVCVALFFAACSSSDSSSSGGGGSTGVVTIDDSLDGATDVAVNSTFGKTFSGAVTTTTVTTDTFYIVPTAAAASISRGKATFDAAICVAANKLDAFVSCTDTTNCSLDPTSDLATGTQYTICLTSDIQYADGSAFTAEMFTFTTASSGVTPAGTVTLTGTVTVASASVSPQMSVTKAAAVESYKVLALNMTTGEQKSTTTTTDGSFSLELVGNSDYSVNIMDNNFKYVGTLATSTASDNRVPVALTTGEDQSETALGTVTANSSTGQITSDQTLNASTSHFAYATDAGVIAGGNSGDGTTDYTTTVGATACDITTATCPDFDRDGVPDIFDTDNNNDGYSDEVDGQTDYCVPAEVKLYVENYPAALAASAAQEGWPTPAEISANTAGIKYKINLTATPHGGYTMDDISSITVQTPDYITQYGILQVANTHACFETLWNTCNGQQMLVSDAGTSYEAAIARSGNESGATPLLDNMFPGDTYILNFAMADGTAHVCSRKINIIPKYYAYALTKDGTRVETSDTIQTSWSPTFTLGWSIAAVGPTGMTYSVYVYPYDNCGQTLANLTPTMLEAGQDAVSLAITNSNLPTSAINMYAFTVYATTANGDQSYPTTVNFTTAASDPCP